MPVLKRDDDYLVSGLLPTDGQDSRDRVILRCSGDGIGRCHPYLIIRIVNIGNDIQNLYF